MQKSKYYRNVFFLPDHITEIADVFREKIGLPACGALKQFMEVTLPTEHWNHEREEEFFADIRKDGVEYSYYRISSSHYSLTVSYNLPRSRVEVQCPDRADVEAVFNVIEKLASIAQRPGPPIDDSTNLPSHKVFIGHGGDLQWRDLKDHLHEKHGYAVEAYEIGARAGHEIRDVLEEMLESSSIAFLVMTGEDETADGGIRARQNVIHELGLFQGRLGFSKAIVLLEEGVEEFSNIHGIHQIRFPHGSIRSAFGDVVATLKRESGDGCISAVSKTSEKNRF